MSSQRPEFEKIPEKTIVVDFTNLKAIIWDSESGSQLYRLGYYGKPIGIKKPKSTYIERPYELTLFETMYLSQKGIISIQYNNKEISISDFKDLIDKIKFTLFDDLYLVYKDLRDKRYIIKPGLKFGSDFSAYKKGPGIDHAPFLIRVFPRKGKIHPLDLVSAGRLANSVKKRYVMATIGPDNNIRYFEFKWSKP